MSKVTKYLLKRIAELEVELFSTKNTNVILESEVIELESQVKNLEESLQDRECSLFSNKATISKLQNKVKELTPEPTFGDLPAFSEFKKELEEAWC